MIVPSRSRKMAATGNLLGVAVIQKTGVQFFRRHGCSPEFAHHHRAGVGGNFRCLARGSVAAKGEREERHRGVSCARDIEYLASLRWNMMRTRSLLEKHHALLT